MSMSSDSEQLGDRLAFFERLIVEANCTNELSKWEQDFLDGINERVLVYRERTYLSPRQLEVLKRIEGKVFPDG